MKEAVRVGVVGDGRVRDERDHRAEDVEEGILQVDRHGEAFDHFLVPYGRDGGNAHSERGEGVRVRRERGGGEARIVPATWHRERVCRGRGQVGGTSGAVNRHATW